MSIPKAAIMDHRHKATICAGAMATVAVRRLLRYHVEPHQSRSMDA